MTLNAWNKVLIVLCIILTVCCLYLVSEIMLKRPETGRYQLGVFGERATVVLDTATGKAWVVYTNQQKLSLKMYEIESPFIGSEK